MRWKDTRLHFQALTILRWSFRIFLFTVRFLQLFAKVTFTIAVWVRKVAILAQGFADIAFIDFIPGYDAQLYKALKAKADQNYYGE